ncbi:MAG: bifunctional lysylphosphatidylglycerol flippase/synthetase MprF, partial [Streptosporangiales bacterium]
WGERDRSQGKGRGVGSRTWPYGLAVLALAVLVFAAAVGSDLPGWLDGPATLAAEGVQDRLLLALLAVLLGMLAYGLARGRAVAYGGTLLVVAVGVVHSDRIDVGAALLAGGVVLALGWPRFHALPARARVRAAVRNGVIMIVAAGLYETMGISHGLPRLSWYSAIGLSAVAVLAPLLASARPPAPGTDDDRGRVRRLVADSRSETLAPFALRTDKSYVFSADGAAAIGYRVLFGVAVVGGDPVGDPDAYRDALSRFLRMCAHNGWRPASLGASAASLPLWREYGMREVGYGDEVLLDTAIFTLATRKMRNVRQAVQRTRNAGVGTRVVRADELSDRQRGQLAAISRRWLDGARERGFSMILDGLLDGTQPDCVFVLAVTGCEEVTEEATGGHQERVVGFQRYAVVGSGTALSLDVMRREPDAPNGLNERMIAAAAEYASAQGMTAVSLNFAAFRALMDTKVGDRTAAQRVGYRVIHLLDPLIQVESLYQFNAKFRPRYVSRGVAFPSWFTVPALLVALLGLEFALPYDRHRVRHDPATETVAVEQAWDEHGIPA